MIRESPILRFDGHTNMARDAALLDAAERDGAVGWRVYGWDGPWISLGMSQDPVRDLLDPELVPWVMRPTGGRAVLHGHDVTVGLAAPISAIAETLRRAKGDWRLANGASGRSPIADRRSPLLQNELSDEAIEELVQRMARSVRAAYRWVAAPIVEALNACGMPAALAEDAATEPGHVERQKKGPIHDPQSAIRIPKSPDCFKVVSPNDIVDVRTMKKACGCALRLTKTAVLLQASIPAGRPLVDPASVFANPSMIQAPEWETEGFAEAFASAIQALCPV